MVILFPSDNTFSFLVRLVLHEISYFFFLVFFLWALFGYSILWAQLILSLLFLCNHFFCFVGKNSLIIRICLIRDELWYLNHGALRHFTLMASLMSATEKVRRLRWIGLLLSFALEVMHACVFINIFYCIKQVGSMIHNLSRASYISKFLLHIYSGKFVAI